MASGTVRVTAFGDVEVDISISFTDDEYEITGMEISGMNFNWRSAYIRSEAFEDHIDQRILDELDRIGWARGQSDCDRADARRKE